MTERPGISVAAATAPIAAATGATITAATAAATAVELRQVSKRYATGTLANDRVDLSLTRGEIHALVGENGAGKSTVMKMLYGLEQPSDGEILLDGRAVRLRSPRDAIAAGIGLVPQHVELVPSFSVADNVVLGCEPRRGPWLDRQAAAEQVRTTAERFGLALEPDAIVDTLSIGEKQRVSLLKALHRGARILLLDEPTAVLPPQQARALFDTLRAMAREGLAVLLITHKMAEVREVADRFTVMRAGRTSPTVRPGELSDAALAERIVGRPVAPLRVTRAHPGATPLLRVRGLSVQRGDGRRVLDDVSLDIAAGEILGIAAVEGNGQEVLAEVLGGLLAPSQGSALLEGRPLTEGGVRAARAIGMADLPEDRMRDGAALAMSVTDNVIVHDYHRPPLSRIGWLSAAKARARAAALLARHGVVAPSPDAPIGSLSGGNMQKVVLAREIATQPRLLLANQPTRGVDIGAARLLHQELAALRDRGAAVLLISTDLDELLTLSDRLVVMARGRIAAHFRADSVDAPRLGLYMTGMRVQPDASATLNAAFATDEEPE